MTNLEKPIACLEYNNREWSAWPGEKGTSFRLLPRYLLTSPEDHLWSLALLSPFSRAAFQRRAANVEEIRTLEELDCEGYRRQEVAVNTREFANGVEFYAGPVVFPSLGAGCQYNLSADAIGSCLWIAGQTPLLLLPFHSPRYPDGGDMVVEFPGNVIAQLHANNDLFN